MVWVGAVELGDGAGGFKRNGAVQSKRAGDNKVAVVTQAVSAPPPG